MDQFPAWQVWADEVEAVLEFLHAEHRLAAFFPIIQRAKTTQHRDALFAEARATYFLVAGGFRILQWEPPGEGATKGEVLVSLGDSPAVFVEVKQPGWQGEFLPLRVADRSRLSAEERHQRLTRMKQNKFVPGKLEGRAVGSHHVAMRVVRRNALP